MNSIFKNPHQAEEFIPNSKKMAELRRQGSAIKEIAEKFGLSLYEVSIILKEELGNAYDQYSLKKKRILTPEEVRKIIKLRKSYCTIVEIARQLKIPPNTVSRTLTEEFNDPNNYFSRANSYESVKKQSEEKLQEIIKLRDIEGKTGFTKGFITRFLADMPGEYLKVPRIRDTWDSLSEGDVIMYLNKTYDTITAQILTFKYENKGDNPAYAEEEKQYRTLKTSCSSKFQAVWNSFPPQTPYRSPDVICLPFVYCFFRSNGIYHNATLFLRRYYHSKHKWFQCLKRIQNHLSGHIYRNRKQVVLDKIKVFI